MKPVRAMILVSSDPLSIERGAQRIYQAFISELKRHNLAEEVNIVQVEDLGRHAALPIAVIYPQAVIYGPLREQDIPLLVSEHLLHGRPVEDLLASPDELSGELSWLRARKGTIPAELRIVLRRAGIIEPQSIEDYILHDGYQALAKTLTELSPQEVIDQVSQSGLQGRGGAGFPVGRKWSFVKGAAGSPKYVICNADESEPGTFKDRMIMEGDPHSVIEAMAITAYAVGASEGFVYIRGEYQLAYQRLELAIQQAHAHGFLGKNILGSNFSFEIHLHAGAGAYICGEETALIESIEGKRGEPRARPPYPPTKGLWSKPTLVNNVETLANVPPILLYGPAWYRNLGVSKSAGTKVYTILGNVNAPGVIEVPMGITLREVITIYGKGVKNNGVLKFFQTGGSSGSIAPASLQDTPMDFEAFQKAGISLGSGALLVCDQDNCVVDIARVLMQFFRFESCGKCTPCRVGTSRAYTILERISEGCAELSELEELQVIWENMEQTSNCGLGQTAAVPVRDILKHFRAEVEAHIRLRVCPTGICAMSKVPVLA